MSCSKIRYKDEISAKIALSNTGKNDHRREKSEVRLYKCHKCKGFHLTSKGIDEYHGRSRTIK
ncbi:hypothetical protein UFOVP1264_47 [uncultured Caudovirales phage]|uniref:Uncharacterized protein n=1 Tax=uncultured Caudovirales phage TaxID=2100421 RepID=A0A6J5RF54_9CAUD|nr:hypothetical protein UFOVP1264_47 [uncultured Caudovirales phage]